MAGLFSGIGGFELAFAQAGFASELLVEIDQSAIAVLKARFPDTVLLPDVLDMVDLPEGVAVMTAGFPCQNLSMAGDKSGIGGPKSRIVTKMFDLIGKSRVPTVVIENVYFMLQLHSGGAMEWIVSRFEDLGYRWAYRVLDSMGFGLPQRRRRVYLVASLELDPREVLFADADEPPASHLPSLDVPLGFYWTEGRSGLGLTTNAIPPLKVGSAVGIPSAPAVLFPDGEVLMPSLQVCERLQGFEPDWTSAAGSAEESRKGIQWRLVGNAVSVPVARWVAERIKTPGRIRDFEQSAMSRRGSWPDAAWNVGEGRIHVRANSAPIRCDRPSISAFRDSTWTRLSSRALDGFLARLVGGGLRTPAGFVEAVRSAPRRGAL